jgi:glycosyltransferase involved in cell wall biosynthesis
MKILICHNSYRVVSGEDTVIAYDIHFLKEHGLDVVEYIRSNKEISDYSIPERLGFLTRTVYSRRSQRDIEELVQREKPDIALVQNVFPLISPSIYYTLHEFRIPIVQLVYNYRLVCPNGILYTQGKICVKCINRSFSHAFLNKCYRDSYVLSGLYGLTLAVHRHFGDLRTLISSYITPDEFLKNKLIAGGYPAERIFPITTPFDSSMFKPHYVHNGWLLYFGRVVKEKGIFTLLKAMKELPESKLKVVGWGEAYDDAKKMILQEHIYNVHFKGPLYGEELTETIKNSLAVVLPTEWYDNSPLVLLHALSLGKPVIASNIDGIPEVIAHGQNGLLFQPGNVSELADKIRLITENESLRLNISQNARLYAEKELGATNRVKKILEVFQYAYENQI